LYTPLKARSWVAVWAGAVPGAIPPLLGWAAATGEISLTSLSLFAVMFFWQIPHFHAIALFRQEEYARAGLRVLPLEQGDVVTRRHIAFWSVVLLAVSATPFAFGHVSAAYLAAAAALGVPFTLLCLAGLRPTVSPRWAHQVFGFSILYMLGLFAALLVTRM
ncbi:MAG: protoheme IX farnesyltransferase, partial [Myxococcales bacterium]